MDKKTLKKLIKEEIQKILKEETTGNIWDSYQMIIFDVLPDKHTIKNIILQALNSGLVSQRSKEIWKRTRSNINNTAQDLATPSMFSSAPPFLYISPTNKELYMGIELPNYQTILKQNPTITPIKYSEIAQ